MKKLGFVEEKMIFERQKIFTILIGFFMVFLFLFVLSLSHYTGYIFGYRELNSLEEINKFYDSKFRYSNIEYNNVINTQESFVMSETTQENISIVSQYGGAVIPGTERTEYVTYDVYILETEDANIIFCADEEVDFTKKKVRVANDNKGANNDVENEFSKYITNNNETYVFYSVSNDYTIIRNFVLLLSFLLLLIIIVKYSKTLRKTTKLGKQIRKIGDYDKIVNEINKQVEEAIYKSNGCVVCKDYIIFTIKNKTKIIEMKNVKSITSTPDENYPDEIFLIEIEYIDENESKKYKFQVYDKTTEEKIINCLNNKKGTENE